MNIYGTSLDHVNGRKIEDFFDVCGQATSFLPTTMYIGFPVSYKTTATILGFPYTDDENDEHFTMINKQVDEHLAKYGLKLHYYDKNVYILGYAVKDFWIGNDKFIQVDDALILILKYKKKLMDTLAMLGANLTEFDIELMEDEPKRVYNPQPYVLT